MVGTTPIIGRNARLIRGGAVIGYGKNISVDMSAELNKEYSVDSVTPALMESGNQTFAWSAERLYVGEAEEALLLAGTKFEMVFVPHGTSPPTTPYETWSNCVITKVGKKAGMTGGIIKNVSGEAMSVTPTDT